MNNKKIIIFTFLFCFFFLISSVSFGEEKKGSESSIIENNTIVFGRYEQDGNLENGPEPLEWIVLGKEENRALLLSKYVLDYRQIHSIKEEFDWEQAEIREWLNNVFFDKAFKNSEKRKMLRIELSSKSLINRSFQIDKNSFSAMSESPALYRMLGAKNYQVPKGIFDFVVCPDMADISLLKKNNNLATKAVPALDSNSDGDVKRKSKLLFFKHKEEETKEEKNGIQPNKSFRPSGYWLRNWSSQIKYETGPVTSFKAINAYGVEITNNASYKFGVRPEILIKLE